MQGVYGITVDRFRIVQGFDNFLRTKSILDEG